MYRNTGPIPTIMVILCGREDLEVSKLLLNREKIGPTDFPVGHLGLRFGENLHLATISQAAAHGRG